MSECMLSDAVRSEFFMQLIKQTSDHPKPASPVNINAWKLLAIVLGCVVPKDPLVLQYLK